MLHAHRAELPDEAVGSTSSRIRAAHDKSSGNACKKSLVVSVMFLADDHYRVMVAFVIEVMEPHVQWHGKANKELRSCPKALQWKPNQKEGDYMEHLHQVKDRMADAGVLQRFI